MKQLGLGLHTGRYCPVSTALKQLVTADSARQTRDRGLLLVPSDLYLTHLHTCVKQCGNLGFSQAKPHATYVRG